MKLIPYDNLKFKTTLNSEQVVERLNEVVEPRKLFKFFNIGKKPYQGSVFEKTFTISSRKSFSQSGLVIKGSLENDYRGCTILVRMRLPFLSILILIMLIFSLFSFLLSEIFTLISGVDSYHAEPMSGYIGILIYGGITVVNYFYLLALFKDKVNKVRKHFCKLFETDEVVESGFEWAHDRGYD